MAPSSNVAGDYSKDANRSVAVIKLGGLSLDAGAVLDLGDNDLILRYAPTRADELTADNVIGNSLISGFDGGLWTGDELISSVAAADGSGTRALGWADNQDIGDTSFDGVDVSDGAEVLVKFTYYGDATLDGKVDAADNGQMAGGLAGGGTGWAWGDFNYSAGYNYGKPTADDASLLAAGLSGYKQFGLL